MPVAQQPPHPNVESIEASSAPFPIGSDPIDDLYLSGLINQSFDQYESWRSVNHDRRWTAHDMLYFGSVAQRYWPGTQTPRSSLSNPIVYEQVETGKGIILNSIFYDRNWFDVEAEDESTPAQARDVKAYLNYVCSYARDNFGRGFELEAESLVHSQLQYGNAVALLEWDAVRQQVVVQWIDLRDVYVDPATPTPFLDDSRGVIIRRLMSVDDLYALRDSPGMRIPSKFELLAMAQNRTTASTDNTKRYSEMQRGVSFSPENDAYTPLPAAKQVEVLIYYSATRVGWLLGRTWIAYNEKNRYGFVPLVSCAYSPVLGRFYGQAISDVIEGEQLYSQAIQNYHLDDLNLRLIPPRKRMRGGPQTPSQLRWYPGMELTVTEKDDGELLPPANSPLPVGQDLAYLQERAGARTGINAGAVSGVPTPSNANRTTAGVNASSGATSTRLSLAVKHFEQGLLIPMFYKIIEMTKIEATEMYLPGTDETGKSSPVSRESLAGPVRFRIYGAAKMISRANLQQIYPFIAQNLLQGPLGTQLNQIGLTVDFMELFNMMQDATGTSKLYSLIRPLSPQEQQAKNQPPPQVVAQQQQAQAETQAGMQRVQMMTQSAEKVAQIDADAKTNAAHESSATKLLEMMLAGEADGDTSGPNAQMAAGAQMAQDKNKAMLDILGGKGKLQLEREKHSQKLQHGEAAHSQKMRHGVQSAVLQKLMAAISGQGGGPVGPAAPVTPGAPPTVPAQLGGANPVGLT